MSVVSWSIDIVNHVVSDSENHCHDTIVKSHVSDESVSHIIIDHNVSSIIVYVRGVDLTQESVIVHEKISDHMLVISIRSSLPSNATSVILKSGHDCWIDCVHGINVFSDNATAII